MLMALVISYQFRENYCGINQYYQEDLPKYVQSTSRSIMKKLEGKFGVHENSKMQLISENITLTN